MRKIRLGRTNAEVSAISLGTWGHGGPNISDGVSVGWSGHDDRGAKEAILTAYHNGINHWDTADAYGSGGHAESLIGEMWAGGEIPRREIFLASKTGWVKGPSGHFYEPSFMHEQCKRSLHNMKVDVIDLYYFHHCDFGPNDEYFPDALAMMRRLKREGKIRFIGLSDWDSHKIMRFIDRVNPDVVQPYRNLIDDEYEASGLKKYVDTHDLGVAFFSPLMHGLLLGKYEEPVQHPEGDFRSRIAQFKDPRFIARMKHAAKMMRQRFADHPEPVLYAVTGALLTGNRTACVLLGQRNQKQAEAAAKAGDPLSAKDAEWVRKVYRGEA
jgi:aryl-alcohol dehydrogenase-like predicted oxidoreductase